MRKRREELTDLFLDPVTAAVLANLVDFEPRGGSRVKLVARRGPARGQVGHHWALRRKDSD